MTADSLGGWVKVFRSVLAHPVWLAERFSRGQAWIDILLRANYKPSRVLRGSRWLDVDRGQLFCSQAQLARRWRWDRRSIQLFLACLRDDGMLRIETSKQTHTGFTILTIVNFERFQAEQDIPDSIGPIIQPPYVAASNAHPDPHPDEHFLRRKEGKKVSWPVGFASAGLEQLPDQPERD